MGIGSAFEPLPSKKPNKLIVEWDYHPGFQLRGMAFRLDGTS
jgi:hypothetical protein